MQLSLCFSPFPRALLSHGFCLFHRLHSKQLLICLRETFFFYNNQVPFLFPSSSDFAGFPITFSYLPTLLLIKCHVDSANDMSNHIGQPSSKITSDQPVGDFVTIFMLPIAWRLSALKQAN